LFFIGAVISLQSFKLRFYEHDILITIFECNKSE